MKKTILFFINFILPISFCFADDSNSIGVIAKSEGINFGFAVNYNSLKNDRKYQDIIKKQATIIVPTNELKWSNIHPQKNIYDFSKSDYIIDFAVKNNIKVRGHTILWHARIPNYITDITNPNELKIQINEHIKNVIGRYKGKIESWDVVNEVINPPDKQPNGLRNSYWYKMLGEEYIDIAFKQAHKTDPRAILFYNEWGVEFDTNWSEDKRNKVIALIKRLKARGVPITGFGIQSHISSNNINFVNSKLDNFIDNLKELGLKVYITELDIKNSNNISNTDISLAYKKYLNIVLKKNKVDAVLIWGVYTKRKSDTYVLFDDSGNYNLNYFEVKNTFPYVNKYN